MSLLAEIRRFFFPVLCPVCGTLLEEDSDIICPTCQATLPRFRMKDETDNALVRLLWNHADVAAGASLFLYRHDSPFHYLLVAVKYRGRIRLAKDMGRWSCRQLSIADWQVHIDFVIPVPMGRYRKRKWGYNQSYYLAMGIAEELDCPLVDCIHRSDKLPSQAMNPQALREEHRLTLDVTIPEGMRGKTVLLVDDVITTGSTMSQCLKALLQADPTLRICVFTLSFAG